MYPANLTKTISNAFTNEEALHRELMLHFCNYLEEGMEQALQDSQDRLNRLSRFSVARDDISIAYVTMNETAFSPPKSAKGCL